MFLAKQHASLTFSCTFVLNFAPQLTYNQY